MSRPRTPAADRFWNLVEVTDSCWLWTGHVLRSGYAGFYTPGKVWKAHRWSYTQMCGPIPDGLQLDHLCRVRHCVNPEHLEPVTPRENVRRGIGIPAQNAQKTHCKHGHPLEGDNVILVPGGRKCRTCRRAIDKRSKARKKSQQPLT